MKDIPQVINGMRLDIDLFDAYIQRLAKHDWHFEDADDMKAYRSGKANETQLKQVANSHPLLQRAFDAYSDYVTKNNGPDMLLKILGLRYEVEDLVRQREAKVLFYVGMAPA
jgi:hypothetical protein